MSEIEKIKDIINSKAVFNACSAAFKNNIARDSRIIKAAKGKILFFNQDDADKFYIVVKGWIKLFRETLDGTQAVVDIVPAGHIFGETCIFEDDTYPYSAEATEPSEILALPLKALKKEIEDNPKLAFYMLSAMARYRRQQDQEIEHRTIQNAPQRIGCFLLRLADQNQDGPITIHLPYDKTLLASRLGMQPETFSRALNKLKNATGIEVKGASIKVENLDRLVNYSCIACSSGFPCEDVKGQSAR